MGGKPLEKPLVKPPGAAGAVPPPLPPPLGIAGIIRTELIENIPTFHMRKLEIDLTTKAADKNMVLNIANAVIFEQRSAFHYSNFHSW
jgi:hypothetical protein